MNQSEDIFTLIRSLTKGEKKFFKLFSSTTKGDKNYIRLFDAIDKQKKYDEKKIKETYPDHFAVKKIYLQKQILKAMRSFHGDGSIQAQLRNTIHSIEFLYKKYQNEHANKLISKSMIVAAKYELFNTELELIDLQMRYYARVGNYSKLERFEKEIYPRKAKLVNLLSLQSKIETLTFPVFGITQTRGLTQRVEDKKRLQKLYDSSKKMVAKSRDSFVLYELLLINLNYTATYLKKEREAYRYSLDLIKLFEKHPHFIDEKLSRYSAHLGGAANRAFDLQMYDTALNLCEKLEGVHHKAMKMKFYEVASPSFYFFNNMRMNVYLLQKDTNAALRTLRSFELGKKKMNSEVRTGIAYPLILNSARVYFRMGEYRTALGYMKQLFESDETNVRRSFIEYAHLLRLMIHYELRNFDLMESLSRSTQRYLRKEAKDELAELFITMMQKVITNKMRPSKLFSEFYPKISKASTRISNREEVMEWVESKLR